MMITPITMLVVPLPSSCTHAGPPVTVHVIHTRIGVLFYKCATLATRTPTPLPGQEATDQFPGAGIRHHGSNQVLLTLAHFYSYREHMT